MAIDTSYYGDVDEANAYFAARLHSQPWEEADPAEKPKAMLAARRLIDNLNFKGDKHAVWIFHQQTPPPWRDPTNGAFDHQAAEHLSPGGAECGSQPAVGVSPRRRHGGSRGHSTCGVRIGLLPSGWRGPAVGIGEPGGHGPRPCRSADALRAEHGADRASYQPRAEPPGLVALEAISCATSRQ